MTLRRISGVVQGIFYAAAGVNHFWHPPFYLKIMPDYIPAHALMVQLSGVCEIAGGLGLLFPQTRRVAGWGIAAMLVVFTTVHVDMIVHHADKFPSMSLLLLWGRLLFQPVLIACALYNRE